MPYEKPATAVGQARAAGRMTIQQAAEAAGVSAKMIRHYEDRGLLAPAPRSDSGYRLYDEADVKRLQFIAQARACRLPLEDAKSILDAMASGDAKLVADWNERLVEIEQGLLRLRKTLIEGVRS